MWTYTDACQYTHTYTYTFEHTQTHTHVHRYACTRFGHHVHETTFDKLCWGQVCAVIYCLFVLGYAFVQCYLQWMERTNLQTRWGYCEPKGRQWSIAEPLKGSWGAGSTGIQTQTTGLTPKPLHLSSRSERGSWIIPDHHDSTSMSRVHQLTLRE